MKLAIDRPSLKALPTLNLQAHSLQNSRSHVPGGFAIGDPAAIDRVIMSYAKTHGYIVFTNDLDFGTLLTISKSQLPSVIQVCNQDLLPDAIGDVVISALRQVQEQLKSGALVTIDHSRLRVRILPIN